MKDCEQTKGQSVLQHGISVKNYTFDLLNHLRFGTPLKYEWKLPDWVYEHKDLILSNLPSDKVLKYYTILHDCGKPYCLEIDEFQKLHGDEKRVFVQLSQCEHSLLQFLKISIIFLFLYDMVLTSF